MAFCDADGTPAVCGLCREKERDREPGVLNEKARVKSCCCSRDVVFGRKFRPKMLLVILWVLGRHAQNNQQHSLQPFGYTRAQTDGVPVQLNHQSVPVPMSVSTYYGSSVYLPRVNRFCQLPYCTLKLRVRHSEIIVLFILFIYFCSFRHVFILFL